MKILVTFKSGIQTVYEDERLSMFPTNDNLIVIEGENSTVAILNVEAVISVEQYIETEKDNT